MLNKQKIYFYAWMLFIAVSLMHYFTLRPLWMDEQYVYDSIEGYSYAQIFGPLKTNQAFPRIYLVCVKFLSDTFNHHLLALRFLSLVFMLAAFFVWLKNYGREIKEEGVFLLTVFSLAASYRLSYYAAELKPYSMDVLVVGLFVMFFAFQRSFEDKKSALRLNVVSALIPVLTFFSYTTIFVIWIPAWNFICQLRKNKTLATPLVLNVLSTIICLFVLYQIDIKHFVKVQGYYTYWKNYFLGYKSLASFFTPFGEGYVEIGTWWYGESRLCKRLGMVFLPFLFYALVRYGWMSLKRNGFRLFTLDNIFGILFLELVVFSLLGRYPFTGDRVTLFMAPFVFYLMAKAIEDLKFNVWVHKVFKSYYFFYLGVCTITTILHYLKKYQF